MKKVFTILAVIGLPFAVSAQSVMKPIFPTSVAVPAYTPIVGNETSSNVSAIMNKPIKPANAVMSPDAVQIGTTTYDLQTNSSVGRRILAYPDGKVSAVWIYSASNDLAAPDRGTGYNSFDGTQWGGEPTSRLEGATRTGWGEIATTTAGEIVMAHVDAISTNTGSGTAWTTRIEAAMGGKTWPRIASSGDNVYAIITTSAQDPVSGLGRTNSGPIYFSKSTDGGATWSAFTDSFVPTYDTSNHIGAIGADSYAIDANGSNVAIFAAGTTEDLLLFKSTDAGVTWTKTVIREFPIHKYASGITDADGDGVGDTLLGSSDQLSVVVDDAGVVHCVFGDLRVIDDDGSALGVFLNESSLNYWNDSDKQIINHELLVDADGDGILTVGSRFTAGSTVRYGNAGYVLQPILTLDPSGLICTFTAVAEADTTDAGVDFRNIWAIRFHTGEETMIDGPVNLSQTELVENAFPSAPRTTVNGKLHINWQQDFEPGIAVQDGHDFTTSNIMYESFDVATMFLGVNKAKLEGVAISAYPNPANDRVTFKANFTKAMNAQFTLTNMLGQEVRSVNKANMFGTQTIDMDIADLPSGVYFYSVKADGKIATEKLIISK